MSDINDGINVYSFQLHPETYDPPRHMNVTFSLSHPNYYDPLDHQIEIIIEPQIERQIDYIYNHVGDTVQPFWLNNGSIENVNYLNGIRTARFYENVGHIDENSRHIDDYPLPDDKNICAISLEQITGDYWTCNTCNNNVSYVNMIQWIDINNSCPLCRTSLI